MEGENKIKIEDLVQGLSDKKLQKIINKKNKEIESIKEKTRELEGKLAKLGPDTDLPDMFNEDDIGFSIDDIKKRNASVDLWNKINSEIIENYKIINKKLAEIGNMKEGNPTGNGDAINDAYSSLE